MFCMQRISILGNYGMDWLRPPLALFSMRAQTTPMLPLAQFVSEISLVSDGHVKVNCSTDLTE